MLDSEGGGSRRVVREVQRMLLRGSEHRKKASTDLKSWEAISGGQQYSSVRTDWVETQTATAAAVALVTD